MPARFADFAATGPVALPLLPVVHTTDWFVFRNLMEIDSVLRNDLCPVFKEELLYLFYGRPCYRMHANVEPNSLSAFFLISIVFEPTSLSAPHRVFPFDSGAFANGLYASSLHPKIQALDFELHPSLQAAAQAVGTLFGSNKRYFSGKAKEDVVFGGRDVEVQSFLSIIRAPGRTAMDDRRSTIEIQLSQSIDIRKTSIAAVILPEELLDDPFTEHFIVHELKATPLGYYCPHARPAEDVRAIMIEAKRYYESRGLL
jgi:hypothetical protein